MSVGGNWMTREQRRDALRQHFEDMHAEVDALPAGPERRALRLLLAVFHRAADAFMDRLVQGGHVQPFSGGEEKPENP